VPQLKLLRDRRPTSARRLKYAVEQTVSIGHQDSADAEVLDGR
jgi:hypothetical protein